MATATTPSRRPTSSANPTKTPHRIRAQPLTENHNPNFLGPSPRRPLSSSKPKKTLTRTLAPIVGPPPAPPERKFIVVKKNPTKRTEESLQDRRLAAYEALRASQDGFFAKRTTVSELGSPAKTAEEELVKGDVSPEVSEVEGTVKVRKMRSKMMEEAMKSMPEQGSGRVLHLVKAFESILSISKGGAEGESKKNAGNWALPGLQPPPHAPLSAVSCSSSAEFLGNSRLCSSLDGSIQSLRLSSDSMTTCGGRRSRRNSSDSAGSRHNKLGVTNLRPFKLRTEQRGRLKEEHFLKKMEEMLIEEEKRRIPQAQGLPWTTDIPESLVKPVVKEATEPADIVLHSDIRAVERAEFDNYVAERMAMAEQKRLERERQQQLEEEDRIRRMRKELVPRAQPMPYFDKPFVPKRSERSRTIPKEPRFRRVRSHKP